MIERTKIDVAAFGRWMMLKHSLLAVLSVPLFVSGVWADDHADIRAACLETAHRYFIALDRRDPESFASVFTENATLVLPRRTMSGKDEIRSYLEAPAPGRRTVHHLTTSQIDVLSSTSAKGTVYVLLNVTIAADDASGSPQTALVSGAYHDTYALEDGVCKIKDRRLDVAIVNPVPELP